MILNVAHFANRCCPLVLAISATLVFLIPPGSASARKPQLADTSIIRGQTSAGAAYMHGGFTFDDRVAMEERSARYNLKIVFMSRGRALTSSILLMIGNNQNRRVDKMVVQGPWLYIQLPPGGYTIMARIQNKIVLIRDVYLRENRRAVYFVRGS